MTELKQYKITDDLSDVKMLDWIEGVGDITTYYELKFIHRFAEAIRSRPLSEELKKEREWVFTQDELQSLFLIVDAYIERTNDKTQETMKLLDKIESLRSEP